MITLASRILQKMLDVNRYAALPFVETGKHNDTHVWLTDLRERLIGVLADIDRAVVQIPSVQASDAKPWSQGEQLAFSEWLVRTYPNEHSAAVMALGDAWQEGKRFGFACASPTADSTTSAKQSTGELLDDGDQLTLSGKVLAHAIAAEIANVLPAKDQTLA